MSIALSVFTLLLQSISLLRLGLRKWAAKGWPKTGGTQKDWTERKNIGLRPGIIGEVSDSRTKGARNKGT